jgi:hypothetical protein
MRADDLRLEELVTFREGALDLHGRRLVLHDVHAFAQFRKDLFEMVGPEQTRPIHEGLRERGYPADRVLIARQAHEVADLLARIVRPGDILLYENRLPDTYLEGGS